MTKIVATDSEFQPILDEKTRPICVTMHSPGLPEAFYIHPRASKRVREKAREVGDVVFQSPCVLFDYFGLEWKFAGKNCKNYDTYDIVIFWSFKDLEFLFADEKIYRDYVLPELSKIRRISSAHLVETDNGLFMKNSISLPYVVHVPDPKNNNKMRWCKVSIQVTDIAAMQGSESLKTYASNVNITMADKETYTAYEKAHMEDMYCEDPFKFKRYALGDASKLQEIREKTVQFYNKIAELIGIEPRSIDDFWGLSTGKIVGCMLHEYFQKKLGFDTYITKDPATGKNIKIDELFQVNSLAGSEGFTNLGKLLKIRKMNYLAMVDGGRAVLERKYIIYDGVLIDIDIKGCYGNGLRNQIYAVGIPTISNERMTLRQWWKKYKSQLIPGLWCARISWDNAPFRQDLLISKTQEAFSTWNWVVNGLDNDGFSCIDDGKKVYDASMALTTNSVHQSVLTHDSLQVIQNYASNTELNWLYDNAIIETSAIYQKKDEVEEVTDEMKKGAQLSSDPDTLIKASKEWVRIDMSPLMDLLLAERSKYPKEDKLGNDIPENVPMNTFLKLIINTIYGVIASEFFSVPGACVSNVIVGNNITSRARVLAWCMAKGFHSAMSITDGGVFDVNKVLKIKQTSLDLFARLYKDKFLTNNKHSFAEQIPLFKQKINHEKALELKKSGELDSTAWLHLKSVFNKLDIFKYDQYRFETKDICTKLVLHSKVDYRLELSDGTKKFALRGMPKVWNESKGKKVIDPRADLLFDAIEVNIPIRLKIAEEQLLSHSDWQKHPDKQKLLPHDTVSKSQTFYSHTPHGLRFKNLAEYKTLQKDYQTAKQESDQLMTELVDLVKNSIALSQYSFEILNQTVALIDETLRIAAMFVSDVGLEESENDEI